LQVCSGKISNYLVEGGGDNSKFFHEVMSSRRRSNTIISILVNGAHIEGVEGVKSVVFDHFNNHFKKVEIDRLGLGDLLFKTTDDVEGVDLIKPFLMEETKEAMWKCDIFKSSGPDDINLRFFKDFWDMLKVDLLIFFCGISP